MDKLKKQMEFILEVDKLKQITRQSYVTDESRKENDSEHSWHLALMCLVLKEYANEEIDALKVMSMVLIHDIVEIDAGDTYAYDAMANESKREREVKAAERIFNILPEEQAVFMRDLWEEFEAGETNEAKFALTLDKIQPILLNNATNGRAWKEHSVLLEQVLKRNEQTKDGSETLWEYCRDMIEENVGKGNIIG